MYGIDTGICTHAGSCIAEPTTGSSSILITTSPDVILLPRAKAVAIVPATSDAAMMPLPSGANTDACKMPTRIGSFPNLIRICRGVFFKTENRT
jgi:hypothetical protein